MSSLIRLFPELSDLATRNLSDLHCVTANIQPRLALTDHKPRSAVRTALSRLGNHHRIQILPQRHREHGERRTADLRRLTRINLGSVAVDGNAGATDFQARPFSLPERRRRSPYLRASAVGLSLCPLCLCGEIRILILPAFGSA